MLKPKSLVEPMTNHRSSQLLRLVLCLRGDGCLEEAILEPGGHSFSAAVPSPR